MNKAEAEKVFVQQLLDAGIKCGNLKEYCEIEYHGNWYWRFVFNDGTARYWTNLSKESALKLELKEYKGDILEDGKYLQYENSRQWEKDCQNWKAEWSEFILDMRHSNNESMVKNDR